MKLYKNLPCDNYYQINEQVKQYVYGTGIVASTNQFWNLLPTLEFIRATPLFYEWLVSIDLQLYSLALTVGRDENCCVAHTDTPPAVFKLSWPIENTARTYNRWFKPIVSDPDTIVNEYGGTHYVNADQLEEIERKELLGPCIINAGVIHDVWIDSPAVYPRLGLQCMLFKEPVL